MKAPDIVSNRINRLPLGYVFTYEEFYSEVSQTDALIKALSRLVSDGKIRRLSKGRFYKPVFSEFGELKPEIYQVVKDLLEQKGKIIGYLTGYSAYNQLGLTTQVSSIIQIGTNETKKGIKRGMYRIRFIKQSNNITKENIPILRILDAIRNIKEIPDSKVEESGKIFLGLIKKLEKEEQELFIRLTKKYNPATRALAGAIFEMNFGKEAAEIIYSSLNPSSEYELGISEKILTNKQKWNII